ncbi:LysE family translocator [Stappia sp. F7233]|uniref:LysE family translocator n=1 Tax=Stappia albiluteola TaxID=2758565 RepID=A0A839AJQ2_9HYPH|nr:LysE family translocator [Stappia albiluteola]MBA5779258.1 LysE family translocator [Stappia albiluteola]
MVEILPMALAMLLAQLTPGPNMMAVSSIALGQGRRDGILTASGVAFGVLIWAALCAFGIGALFAAYPQAITAMKLIGGGYLALLGGKALIGAFRAKAVGSDGGIPAGLKRRQAFRTGLFVVLTNPKAALMWIAVSLFIGSAGGSGLKYLTVGLLASLSALTIYCGYALLFSTGFAARAHGRFYRAIETAFGTLFGLLGARLLFEGAREIRG